LKEKILKPRKMSEAIGAYRWARRRVEHPVPFNSTKEHRCTALSRKIEPVKPNSIQWET
jgi:hypothetical protein